MRLTSLEVHAFQALGYLGASPDRWVTAAELCEKTAMTRPFMLKVLGVLVRGQVVASQRGLHGGYRLARAPEEVTLLEVIHLLDRPVAPLSCVSLSAPTPCVLSPCCGIRRGVYEELRHSVHGILSRFTAADLARDVRAEVGYRHCLDHLWPLGDTERPGGGLLRLARPSPVLSHRTP